MKIEKISKQSFCVIGIEGSTQEGSGFIQRLWNDANSRFGEISDLAVRNSDGTLAGIWGAMTDFSRSFLPWQNDFSQGLYLAGAECMAVAQPPEGWCKWQIPGFVYLRVEAEAPDTFRMMLDYMNKHGYPLAGAVHDYTDPATGKSYMYFPIEYLEEA